MKANEAPEKLYVNFHFMETHPESHQPFVTKQGLNKYDIEYTRTDAFIEKAVKWIEEINNYHHIMRYSDSCEPPICELTEWFKNYMKEGGKE